MARAGPAGRAGGEHARSVPSLRLAAAVSFAGVRGAITLAGVLTFPLAMPNGSPFPARELCILIAAGVIILSLTWANVSLPRLLTGLTLPPDDSYEDEEDRVRMAAAQAAMRAVQRAQERLSLNGDDATSILKPPMTCWRCTGTAWRAADERRIARAKAGVLPKPSSACGSRA